MRLKRSGTCDTCRKRKIRCDAVRRCMPCTRYRQGGIDCVVLNIKSRGKKSTMEVHDGIDGSLEEEENSHGIYERSSESGTRQEHTKEKEYPSVFPVNFPNTDFRRPCKSYPDLQELGLVNDLSGMLCTSRSLQRACKPSVRSGLTTCRSNG